MNRRVLAALISCAEMQEEEEKGEGTYLVEESARRHGKVLRMLNDAEHAKYIEIGILLSAEKLKWGDDPPGEKLYEQVRTGLRGLDVPEPRA